MKYFFRMGTETTMKISRPILLIHGGCGLIARKSMTSDYEQECRNTLKKSLQIGYDILINGGSAVDACVAAVQVMEDHPNFNAGKGSVFTTSYKNEMDAGIMDGSTGTAGGVSTVTKVKNPILLAKRIMETTPHTVLCGPNADSFAEKQGLEIMDEKYFFTQRRFDQLEILLKKATTDVGLGIPKVTPVPQLDHNIEIDTKNQSTNGQQQIEKPCDTVGAVALDLRGRLASSSSTGGMTGKLAGRLSDSSIPGAGFWADTNAAISMTGNGDYFLRRSISHELASMVKYANMDVNQAAKKVIFEMLSDCHAGAIVLDSNGHFSMPYNSEGMFRGSIMADGSMDVLIWEY